MEPVKINWSTNINKKLDCEAFLHVDRIPDPKPPLSSLEGMLVEITTTDGSHQPVVKMLHTAMTLMVKEITTSVAFASHGISAEELKKNFLTIPEYTADTIICMYYYCSPVVQD
jgi:hypothetical protein